ncbi:multiprotein-bridging factor 1c [Arachis hypogaea]|uniref:multiprotein-bridging factor 1c n=1 Tax=Arachis hypogaea TaxID=3818 RepID=UPI003B2212E0
MNKKERKYPRHLKTPQSNELDIGRTFWRNHTNGITAPTQITQRTFQRHSFHQASYIYHHLSTILFSFQFFFFTHNRFSSFNSSFRFSSKLTSCFATMPTRSTGTITQDWEPVVLHKSRPKAQDLRNPKAVNQALRSGAEVQTIKKFDAGSNRKPGPGINARKLEEGTEPAALERVAVEVRQAIQKARLDKKMSQAELAKQINERPQVVQEYENGKAQPNQAVLAKMERVLGVKLRGKIGK